MASSDQISLAHKFTRPDGAIELEVLVRELRVTKTELAAVLGMSQSSLTKPDRHEQQRNQRKLRDLVEILVRVASWAGSIPQAFAWFRAQPLTSFGDQTAADVFRDGRAEALKAYVSRIAVGGYS